MIDIHTLVVLLPLLAHGILAIYMVIKVAKSTSLTKKHKRINIILVLLIPFVWSVLMYYVLKKEPDYFDKRKHITNDKLESAGQLFTLPSDHHSPS